MSEHNDSRRKFIKVAAYTAPVILTLNAAPTFAKGGSIIRQKCNQGLGNYDEGCDPGNSNNHNPTNDETGALPGRGARRGTPG